VLNENTGADRETSTSLGGGYASAQDALKAVNSSFNNWTQALSDRSVQLSYALVAANWAVFSSANRLLANTWAVTSLAIVVAFLVLNLVITRIVAEKLRARYDYAEDNAERWEKEFAEKRGKADPWPFTSGIDAWARALRELRTWLPLLAGGAFFVAVLVD
jgi:hypothetical protein